MIPTKKPLVIAASGTANVTIWKRCGAARRLADGCLLIIDAVV